MRLLLLSCLLLSWRVLAVDVESLKAIQAIQSQTRPIRPASMPSMKSEIPDFFFPLEASKEENSRLRSHLRQTTQLSQSFDSIAPVISPMANIGPIEATSASGAVVTFQAPSWTDAVDGSGLATCAASATISSSTYPLGVTTITCSQTDAAGNVATPVVFTITVVDTTAPVFSPMPNIGPIEATSASGAVVTFQPPTLTDAVEGTQIFAKSLTGKITTLETAATCALSSSRRLTSEASSDANSEIGSETDVSPVTEVAITDLSGRVYALGVTTVTCSKTDAAGNSATPVVFTITIVDTTCPFIQQPSNVLVTLNSVRDTQADVNYPRPTWTDAVDGSGVADCAPNRNFKLGDTTVTCTRADGAGNSCPVFFIVTVVSMPTMSPTPRPSSTPVAQPTFKPTRGPTPAPSESPVAQPTFKPTRRPIPAPSESPVAQPTFKPSSKVKVKANTDAGVATSVSSPSVFIGLILAGVFVVVAGVAAAVWFYGRRVTQSDSPLHLVALGDNI